MVTQTETRTIIVKTDDKSSRNLKRISKEFGTLNKNVSTVATSFGRIQGLIGTVFAGAGLRALTDVADRFQLIGDRIRVLSDSSEEATATFSKLIQSAKLTRTSVESLGESYNRIALATKELGLSQDQILATTVALQNSFRISGSTIAETTASVIQLAQGLSSGQLRGQELRSVVEQNAVFANLLSEELGVARGQLIKFAESGKITSDVVLRALSNNFDTLNEQAQQISTTFGQTLTIALDAVGIKIKEFNEEFNLSKTFEFFVKQAIDNLDLLNRAILGFTTALVVYSAPKIIAAISAINVAVTANPILLALSAAVGAAIFFGNKFEETMLRVKKFWLETLLFIEEKTELLSGSLRFVLKAFSFLTRQKIELKIDTKGVVKILKKDIAGIEKQLIGLGDKKPESIFDRLKKSLLDLNVSINVTRKGIALLNEEYKIGKITLDAYNRGVRALDQEELNRKFAEGKIQVQEYNAEIRKIQLADQDWKSFGDTVDSVILGIKLGSEEIAAEQQTLAQGIAAITVDTFGRMEDSLTKFITTGKGGFEDFVNALIEDLVRLQIRMQIIQPLAAALFGGSVATQSVGTFNKFGANVVPSAKGNVVSGGNIIPFANGGVVSRPTLFPLSGGNTGLMGEAGAEAIVPLTRTPSGELGVRSTGSGTIVNVINNANTNVETRESEGPNGEKVTDIFITDRVKRAFANGTMDRTMNEIYGVQRKGR